MQDATSPSPSAPAPGTALVLTTPTTQTDVRRWLFAKRICETARVDEAYRDVYDPGEDITHNHYINGNNLIKHAEVGKIIGIIGQQALVELGVDRAHALKRLLETVDSDITDYFEGAEFGSPDFLRGLPFEKRRLIKKYKEKENVDGSITREIELESKSDALRLLAQIQHWVQPGATVVVNNETIVQHINFASKQAVAIAQRIRDDAAKSKSAAHLSRAANVPVA